MNTQPEALRLAEELEIEYAGFHDGAELTVAAELRRLHKVNPELVEALEKVMSWTDNWSPELIFDPDWPTDRDAAIASLAKAR